MLRVVVTGGPGAGKTTLLCALAKLGFEVVGDSAREVIAERLARGETPRPGPKAFAREILRRDVEKYAALRESADLVFFDRSVLEALAMVHEAAPLSDDDLKNQVGSFFFHRTVFVLPPWKDIYRTDAERDHSFAHSERVHEQLVRWYSACGYRIHEVPRAPVDQRVHHVLHVVATGEA